MPRKNNSFPGVTFSVSQEYLGDDALWNPKRNTPPLECGFQVNVYGSREHYLRLADAIREFAERNTGNDGEYHDHFDGLLSVNGKVRLHVILRKDDVGDSSWWTDCHPSRQQRTPPPL